MGPWSRVFHPLIDRLIEKANCPVRPQCSITVGFLLLETIQGGVRHSDKGSHKSFVIFITAVKITIKGEI